MKFSQPSVWFYGERISTSTVVAAITLFVFCGLLLARVGLIPVASTGDEVWYSESAYWLMQEGVLRRDFHDDEIGSAVRDFLPPAPAIGQFIAFSIGGLTPFTIAIAPTALCIIITLLLFAAANRITRRPGLSAIIAPAFLFVPDAVRVAAQPRFDIYVAFLVVAAMIAAFSASTDFKDETSNRRVELRLVLSGIFLASSVLSYYAFLPVAATLGFVALFLPNSRTLMNRFASLVIGGAIPALFFLLWIGDDFPLFLSQNLSSGGAYGFVERLGHMFTNIEWLHLQTVMVATIAGALTRIILKSNRTNGYSTSIKILCAATLLTCFMTLFSFQDLILIASSLTVMLAILSIHFTGISSKTSIVRLNLHFVILIIMSMSAFALVTAYSAKGLIEKDRVYTELKYGLLKEGDLSGIVLIDNPAWLALRGALGPGKLVHLTKDGADPSRLNRSRMLFKSDASEVSMIAIRPQLLEELSAANPAMAAFVARTDVEGPIVVGPNPPNRMHVYRLKRPVVSND